MIIRQGEPQSPRRQRTPKIANRIKLTRAEPMTHEYTLYAAADERFGI